MQYYCLSPPSLRRRSVEKVSFQPKGRFVYFGALWCQSKNHSGSSVESLKVSSTDEKQRLQLSRFISRRERFGDDAARALRAYMFQQRLNDFMLRIKFT